MLPGARGRGTIFTYGDTIYISHQYELPIWLVEHENIHILQQTTSPQTPDDWWEQYLRDKAFRFGQELIAHRREYEVAVARGNRLMRRKAAAAISGRLSGPLYGHCCTKAMAKRCLLSKEWPDALRLA